MCCAKPTQQLSVGTEGQDLSVSRYDALKFKLNELGLDTFHLKILAIVNTMKQTKRDSV
jgi:hypothetical protein